MRNRNLLYGLLAAFLLIISACDNRQGILTIATDLPEVAEYLEFVRDEISPPLFRVIFDANPDRNTVLGDISPDIIISSRIAHENFSNYLYEIPFSRLNKQGGNNADNFVLEDIHHSSYAPYVKEGTVRVFLLAFDLPIVYLGEELMRDQGSGAFLTYDRLLETAEEYTELRRNIYSAMGFSSLRNILFIDLLIREYTNLHGSIPPPDELEEAMKSIIEYLNNRKQEPSAQVYYNDVFAYSSDHSSLMEGNLHSGLSSFYAHNTSRDPLIRRFPYVWLYSGEQSEALNPVYIGIVQSSRHKRQGIDILRQLLSADVQTSYLKKHFDREMPFAAFLFRLSSNYMVNQYIIPQFSDNNITFIPKSIVFPEQPVFLWDEIKTQVYYPWIAENLIAQEISTDELYQSLDSYYKLNSEY